MKLMLTEKKIENKVNEMFNKKISGMNLSPDQMLIQDDESFRMAENYAWYNYNTEQLLEFYHIYVPINSVTYSAINYFYRVKASTSKSNSPVCHFNLASMLTNTMSNLVFGKDPIILSNGANKLKNKKIEKELTEILNDNKQHDLFFEAAEMKSYSGAVGFKLIMDSDYSNYPIIIPYPKERIKLIKKYDRIQEIDFIDIYYKEDNKTSQKYKLYSRYGKGYIKYNLYKETGVVLTEIPIGSIEETSGLRDINIVYDGVASKKIYAVYLENGNKGRSDYEDIKDDFAALDETYSCMVDFIRKSKIITYRPENTLKLNSKTLEHVIDTSYDSTEVIVYDSDPNADNKERTHINRDVVELENSIVSYRETMTAIIKNACLASGISPATLGIDAAGANSSSLALEIRERVSLATRAEMVKKWSSALSDLSGLLIELNNSNSNGSNTIVIKDDYSNSFSVDFGEYLNATFADLIKSLGDALKNNLIDLKSALQKLYPDLDDEQIQTMLDNIQKATPIETKNKEDKEDTQDAIGFATDEEKEEEKPEVE